MSSPADAALLNENQRRHLGVTLGQIQRLMREVETMLDGPARTGGMEVEVDDVPREFARRAVALLAEVNGRIDALAARFGLSRHVASRFRWIRSVLGASIDSLEDARAAALRAFGEVHPALSAALDPELASLQDRLETLLTLLYAEMRRPT